MQNMHQESFTSPNQIGPAIPPHKQIKKSRIAKEVVSTFAVLLLAPIAALLFTAYVFQFYRVDGPSMAETLHNNDRLIVYKLPISFSKLRNNDYIPKRGEIIVFNKKLASGELTPTNRQLIKRVIGIPGDRIVVKDNTVTLYNADHPEGYDPDAGLSHQKYTVPTSGKIDITLDEGQVFVMGDNRPNSLDSRVFGPIKAGEIVGKLVMRVYPLKPIEN